MRLLLTIHHAIDENRGAAGATVRLARALRQQGCDVDLYGFENAFRRTVTSVATSAQFPLRFAAHAALHASRYDVIDASSGDAWLWASAGRPGAKAEHCLVFRSHGLEHTADHYLRSKIESGRAQVRKRYYLYHGGFRLWEVAQSLRMSDRAIFLNEVDQRVAIRDIQFPERRTKIIPHGLPPRFFDTIPELSPNGPIHIAFIGAWNERKGSEIVPEILAALVASGIEARLLLLGTIIAAEDVLKFFAPETRPFVTVVPSYTNENLNALLSKSAILLAPSRSEGFNLGLVEAMARGLVPVTTATGVAPEIIHNDENGYVLPTDDQGAFVETIGRLARDRIRLIAMRERASVAAEAYRWEDVARRTIDVYNAAITERRMAKLHTPRNPIMGGTR